MGWVGNVTPQPLYTRERPGANCGIVCGVGWASGPDWTGEENLATTWIRSPDRLYHSETLYRLRYPSPHNI
jgi:hypothetical protein